MKREKNAQVKIEEPRAIKSLTLFVISFLPPSPPQQAVSNSPTSASPASTAPLPPP